MVSVYVLIFKTGSDEALVNLPVVNKSISKGGNFNTGPQHYDRTKNFLSIEDLKVFEQKCEQSP